MSVTIVASLPKSTPANAPANAAAADGQAGAPDFASLLLGQLPPAKPEVLAGTLLPKESADASDSAGLGVPTEAAPSDAAALLAALGLAPQDHLPRNSPALKTTDTGDNPTGKPESSSGTVLNAVTSDTQAVKPQEIASGVNTTGSTPSGIEATDDKPAKFAATLSAAQVADPLSGKNQPLEHAPEVSTTPVVASHAPTHPVQQARDSAIHLPTPVSDARWTTDFGQKIVWMASSHTQSAELTLNPPQMGPIEISLNVDKGNATATFSSANAEVREAIETAMPRLREMLASAGIELGQANVSAESFRQQAENGEAQRQARQGMTDKAILVAEQTASSSARAFATQRGVGMVDIFA